MLGLPRDTARLKKHITLLCDRIGKGGRLTLASEANVQVPIQVQNLAAPGESVKEGGEWNEMYIHEVVPSCIQFVGVAD